jgi:uncharacterized protein YjcR
MEKNGKTIKALKPEIKRLYLDGKSVADICSIIKDVHQSTIYGWIQKEKWNEIRDKKLDQYTNTPDILMDMLHKLIQQIPKLVEAQDIPINERVRAVAQMADSIGKIVKSIKTISKDKDRLSSIIFTVGEMGKLLNTKESKLIYDDEFRIKFDKFLSEFQSYAVGKYSPKNLNS